MSEFWTTIDFDMLSPRYWGAMPEVPYLLPASSWSRKMKNGIIPTPKLPPHLTEIAADCGGFVATFRWGDYRYSPEQYVRWLYSFYPRWSAMMDYCCEDEITSGNRGIVEERQHKTTDMAWHFWKGYKNAPWAWVPTIQGWNPEDYQRHAKEMLPLILEMKEYYKDNPYWRIGIGTLCRRSDVNMIWRVVSAVSQELPDVRFHLWGVKLDLIKSRVALPSCIMSVDSAAWNGDFGQSNEKWKTSGMRRREYRYRVALPEYLAKFKEAVNSPKQLVLFSH